MIGQKYPAFLKNEGLCNHIYTGISNLWAFFGEFVRLKENLKILFTEKLTDTNIILAEVPILTPENNLKISGHLDNFKEKYAVCNLCDKKYNEKEKFCCNTLLKFEFSENEMFKIENNDLYLRPETCVGLFKSFSYLSYFVKNKPFFGLLQIGKSFRKEYSSNKKLFRLKEFEQIELELAISKIIEIPVFFKFNKLFYVKTKRRTLKYFKKDEFSSIYAYYYFIINFKKIVDLLDSLKIEWKLEKILKKDLPHYSRLSFDILANLNGDFIEIATLSDRGNYDIKSHFANYKNFSIIEFSFGVERLAHCVLAQNYFNKLENNFMARSIENCIVTLSDSPVAPYDYLVYDPLNLIKKNIRGLHIINDKSTFIKKAKYANTLLHLPFLLHFKKEINMKKVKSKIIRSFLINLLKRFCKNSPVVEGTSLKH